MVVAESACLERNWRREGSRAGGFRANRGGKGIAYSVHEAAHSRWLARSSVELKHGETRSPSTTSFVFCRIFLFVAQLERERESLRVGGFFSRQAAGVEGWLTVPQPVRCYRLWLGRRLNATEWDDRTALQRFRKVY